MVNERDVEVAAEILHERHGVTGPVVVHETWGASVVVERDGLFFKANGDRSTITEALVTRKVRAAGVPVPDVIDSGTDARLPGGTWIVMPRMPGVAFDASNATPVQIDRAVAGVARNLALLRHSSWPGWGWVDENGRGASPSWPSWLHERITDTASRLGDRLPDDFARSAHHMIDAAALDLPYGSILNGDLGLSHILVDETGEVTGILDWAAAIIGDPVFDVATFSMGGPAGDPIQDVLQPRLLVECGVDAQEPRIRLYRAINHLFNAVWSVDNNVTTWTEDLCRAAVELVDPLKS